MTDIIEYKDKYAWRKDTTALQHIYYYLQDMWRVARLDDSIEPTKKKKQRIKDLENDMDEIEKLWKEREEGK